MKKLLVITAMACALWAGQARAANLGDAFTSVINKFATPTGFNTGSENRKVEPILNNIISVVLSFLGVIFVILAIFGGYKYMTARGDPGTIKSAQGILTAAVIGLIIVVAAYAITFFVIARFTTTLLTQ